MKTRFLITLGFGALLTGCTCNLCGTPVQTSAVERQVIKENNIRGTVTQEWHETMHDTVNVPGQIDPTNTYYRAPHKTVVEIRPGKYSDTKFDSERNQ